MRAYERTPLAGRTAARHGLAVLIVPVCLSAVSQASGQSQDSELDVPASTPSSPKQTSERKGFYLDVGTGVGGFWAWTGEAQTRAFTGVAPWQLAVHLGRAGEVVVVGVGYEYESIAHLSADLGRDANGAPLRDPSELEFSLHAIGLFLRLYPLRDSGFNLATGLYSSSLSTSRDGELEEPSGLKTLLEAAYDFPIETGIWASVLARCSYHSLSVNETGSNSVPVRIFQPTLGVALRL